MTFLKSQTNKENVMRRRKNKIIAGTVVAVMMAGSIMANISPVRIVLQQVKPLIKKVCGLQKFTRMM